MSTGTKVGLGVGVAKDGYVSNGGGQPEFIISVKTDNAGTSASNQFTLPMIAGTYDVDWGDGNIDLAQSGTQTHTYTSADTYEIKVTGGTHIQFINGGDKGKLIDIKNWGTSTWTSMISAFFGCSNLATITATDSPDLSVATNLTQMFRGCSSLDCDIDHWDVSNVVSLYRTFYGCSVFNSPLNSWDVSSLTILYSTFSQCLVFNQPLTSWGVAALSGNLYQAFYYCKKFNQPLNHLNVSAVTNFYACLAYMDDFNQSVNDWDVSSATSIDRVFWNSDSFNQPLNQWNLSLCTNIYAAFDNCAAFNQDISDWDINQCTNISSLLRNNGSFSTANYDALLIAWDAQGTMSFSGTANFGATKYTAGGAAETARTSLIAKWGAIVDGGAA